MIFISVAIIDIRLHMTVTIVTCIGQVIEDWRCGLRIIANLFSENRGPAICSAVVDPHAMMLVLLMAVLNGREQLPGLKVSVRYIFQARPVENVCCQQSNLASALLSMLIISLTSSRLEESCSSTSTCSVEMSLASAPTMIFSVLFRMIGLLFIVSPALSLLRHVT
jgi:hypothetical protein